MDLAPYSRELATSYGLGQQAGDTPRTTNNRSGSYEGNLDTVQIMDLACTNTGRHCYQHYYLLYSRVLVHQIGIQEWGQNIFKAQFERLRQSRLTSGIIVSKYGAEAAPSTLKVATVDEVLVTQTRRKQSCVYPLVRAIHLLRLMNATGDAITLPRERRGKVKIATEGIV